MTDRKKEPAPRAARKSRETRRGRDDEPADTAAAEEADGVARPQRGIEPPQLSREELEALRQRLQRKFR